MSEMYIRSGPSLQGLPLTAVIVVPSCVVALPLVVGGAHMAGETSYKAHPSRSLFVPFNQS
jgi:hypothetical protein